MIHQSFAESMRVSQRDAGEQAVIRHLEARGLVMPAQRANDTQLSDIAQAMYARYERALCLHLGESKSEPCDWHALDDVAQLAWIAAAGEAVAQVAAMNATGQAIAD